MYCIIPKELIKDKTIVPNAKLLYSVIVNVSSDGICYRSNKWFADIFGVNKLTVSQWLQKLKAKNYIDVIVERGVDEYNRYWIKRTIKVNM